MGNDSEFREQLARGLAELKGLGAQIRDRMTDASAEAREKWRELEPKLEDFERKVERETVRVEEAAVETYRELSAAVRKLAERMRKP